MTHLYLRPGQCCFIPQTKQPTNPQMNSKKAHPIYPNDYADPVRCMVQGEWGRGVRGGCRQRVGGEREIYLP